MTTTILSGSTSSGLTIGDGDFLLVSSGGVASATTVLNGGTENVFRGGMVTGSVVSGGGTENVSSGGVAVATVLNGGEQVLFSGGTATGTEVSDGGNIVISVGGVTDFATVSSGGIEYVFAGGQADGTTIGATGLEILFGGVASGNAVDGDGTQEVKASGAVASATTVTGEEFVFSGGVAIGSVVSQGGFDDVENNGTVSDVTVSDGGSEFVSVGGMASETTVRSGGFEYVRSGGVAISATIVSGGFEVISNGGSANFTTIGFGATEVLSLGGTAISTTVDPNGTIDVTYLPYASGGSASVTPSGLLTVAMGGETYTRQLSEDSVVGGFTVAPDASSGTLIIRNVTARTLVWGGGEGTGFSAAANWNDVTDTLDPAQTAPGPIDTAEFLAGGGLVDGTGTAAALEFGGVGQWLLTASSTLTVAGSAGVTVGVGGTGQLSLTGGATIISLGATDAISGVSPQAASVIVTGTGSEWASRGELLVGGSGLGFLAIQAGGTVTADSGLVIANTVPAAGSYVDISGVGSNLNVTGLLDAGVDGSGSLSISDGASVTAGTIDAGNIASATGDISVTDADFIVTGDAVVADDGTGVMSVLNGATFSAANLTIGSQGDSSGALVVSGDGSVVNIAGDLNVGTALGTGDLTIGPGATVNAKVINLQGEVVLENGTLDPTVNLINQGLTAGGSGAFSAGDIVDEGVLQAGDSEASQKLLVVSGTVVGGGPWTINGTAQAQANGEVGVLQINTGGTLEMDGAVSNAAMTTFTDDVTPQSTYAVGDSVIHVDFEDAAGVLKLDDIAGFAGTIMAFQAGDEFVITGGSLSNLNVSNSNTLTVSDSGHGGTDRIMFASPVSASEFNIVGGDTIQVACFAAGTRIKTDRGWVAVEELHVGDRAVTADCRSEPIISTRQRAVDCKRHPRPETVWPVRIAAGAFGDDVPARDVYLSPDHAVLVNDVLVPAKLLINGGTIKQAKRNHVKYFHVELPHHAVILADGLPVESYLDTGDRAYTDSGARWSFGIAMIWETKGAAQLVMTGEALMRARRWHGWLD